MLGKIRTACAVVCRGRRRGEEEGLGHVGYSSNRLKWSTDPNYESRETCINICFYTTKEKLSLLAERDDLVVFGCLREPAVAADVCLRTVVVLGLQLLVQAEHAGALHG